MLGIRYESTIARLKSRSFVLILIMILTVSTSISLRTSLAVSQRANSWDIAFQRNYCLVTNTEDVNIEQLPLSGPEIIFPFFHKGIEDIQTWEWMKIGYVKWIKSGKIQNPPDCEKFKVA